MVVHHHPHVLTAHHHSRPIGKSRGGTDRHLVRIQGHGVLGLRPAIDGIALEVRGDDLRIASGVVIAHNQVRTVGACTPVYIRLVGGVQAHIGDLAGLDWVAAQGAIVATIGVVGVEVITILAGRHIRGAPVLIQDVIRMRPGVSVGTIAVVQIIVAAGCGRLGQAKDAQVSHGVAIVV